MEINEKLTKFVNCENIDYAFLTANGFKCISVCDKLGEVVMTAYVDKNEIDAICQNGNSLIIDRPFRKDKPKFIKEF